MKDNLRAQDKGFVAAELARSTERLQKCEQAGEIYFAAGETRSVIAAFDGLTDTSLLKARLAALENNPSVRTGARQEKTDLDKQRSLEADIVRTIQSLPNTGDQRDSEIIDVSIRIRQLREELRKEHHAESQVVLKRALAGILVTAMEAGSPILEKGDGRTAATYFGLAAIAAPELPWPHFSLASCHAITRDKKAALRDLKEAREAGASPAEIAQFVKADARLANLVDSPEYQKLVTDTKP